MQTIDIDEAAVRLSQLVDQAVSGEPFIISREGKLLVKVVALSGSKTPPKRRLGFLRGQISAPADFDDMSAEDIGKAFRGKL
jgi:antitoxin (DNA-binding transcriptional repressor) of toxin-antitoxin stability system